MKIKTVYYCEYDGYLVVRYENDAAVIVASYNHKELMENAVHVNAFSHEFVAYGFVEV